MQDYNSNNSFFTIQFRTGDWRKDNLEYYLKNNLFSISRLDENPVLSYLATYITKRFDTKIPYQTLKQFVLKIDVEFDKNDIFVFFVKNLILNYLLLHDIKRSLTTKLVDDFIKNRYIAENYILKEENKENKCLDLCIKDLRDNIRGVNVNHQKEINDYLVEEENVDLTSYLLNQENFELLKLMYLFTKDYLGIEGRLDVNTLELTSFKKNGRFYNSFITKEHRNFFDKFMSKIYKENIETKSYSDLLNNKIELLKHYSEILEEVATDKSDTSRYELGQKLFDEIPREINRDRNNKFRF